MELSKQVASLELSKRLKELGVKQESIFYWAHGIKDTDWSPHTIYDLERSTTIELDDCVAAVTVAELGEMLPGGIHSFKCNTFHFLNKEKQKWWCDFQPGGRPADMKNIYEGNCFADTEADARAKMLIYLLENKLINPA